MQLGIDAEKDTLQSLIRSCLLELNKLKLDLTELEVERANDNTSQRIKELEQDIVEKEKEVSVIKFKAEDEVNLLKKQLDEKDILIKNQEDRIYELDYVNNSLDEIKEYFAEQLRNYKKEELADVNDRLNESFKSIAEKEAQINTLSRTIDEYKIKVLKLENNVESQTKIMELEKELEFKNNEILIKDSEISKRDNEIDIIKQQTIPRDEYISLQTQFESEISAMDNEISSIKQEYVPKDEYVSLQTRFENEISARNSELEYIKERSVPRDDYLSLQNRFETEITARDNELRYLKEQTVSREEFLNLQNELNRKNDKIKRLEEINTFFKELQEEQEAYETPERVPPFRLEKKQGR